MAPDQTRISIVAATCGKADNDADCFTLVKTATAFSSKLDLAVAAQERIVVVPHRAMKRNNIPPDRTIALIST
jgi:hypothetical protein